MIKRRFYRFEHGDKDADSGESSSSDSEVEADARDETEDDDDEEEEDNAVAEVGENEANSSSGYESEDSSANEVNLDSSGLPTSDDDLDSQNAEERIVESLPRSKGKPTLAKTHNIPETNEIRFDATDYVLRCKSVFKCRICPRIVCLSEETIKAHLNSKGHARSEKLLREGRLKLMLNEKGQIEGETLPEEEDADSEQELRKSKRKNKGRLKQKKRLKQEKALTKAGSSTLPMNRRERRRNVQSK